MIVETPELIRVGAVVLAAGKGTRMRTDSPKVLQRLLEVPMICYVCEALSAICEDSVRMAVIGHGAAEVRSSLADWPEQSFIFQKEQRGTGHALQTAWPMVLAKRLEYVLVVNGDTPLITPDVLRSFLAEVRAEDADLAFISLTLGDPGVFGRVVRRDGQVRAIVEAKDYNPAEQGPEPNEVNAGIYCLRTEAVSGMLQLLNNDNAAGETYITDLVQICVSKGLRVTAHNRGDDADLLGVNTPMELAQAEERLRMRLVQAHLDKGAIIRSPQSIRIGPDVEISPGADITGPCELYGRTRIGRARIASHCRMDNAVVEDAAEVHSFCHVQDARIGAACSVGPYARLRPGTVLEQGARVGNFVEVKQARMGKNAKAGHLSYLGDTDVGEDVNIGAGTITCNYDGKQKHRTNIHRGAFIGSNTAIVAPVSIGENALVGAGSVITADVPENHLALSRVPQRVLPRKR